MCVNATYADDGWVDHLLSVMKPRTVLQPPVARPGSLWVSVATKRRASVVWASATHVKLSYTDHAFKVLKAEQLMRLYAPVL